jgi:SPP1 family holin
MKGLPFDKSMIIRSIILLIVWVNQFLVVGGYGALPFDDVQTELGVTYFVTFMVSMWNWWKNNDLTKNARYGTEVLKNKGLK